VFSLPFNFLKPESRVRREGNYTSYAAALGGKWTALSKQQRYSRNFYVNRRMV